MPPIPYSNTPTYDTISYCCSYRFDLAVFTPPLSLSFAVTVGSCLFTIWFEIEKPKNTLTFVLGESICPFFFGSWGERNVLKNVGAQVSELDPRRTWDLTRFKARVAGWLGQFPSQPASLSKTICSGLLKETMLFGHEVKKKKTELILFSKKI